MNYTVILSEEDLNRKVILNRDDLQEMIESTARRVAQLVEDDRIVGISEIASRFGYSRGYVYSQIAVGNLTPIEEGSNRYRLGDARMLFEKDK